MELLTNYFKFEQLPSGAWTITWPGHIDEVVTTVTKACNLLELLFNKVKVDEAQLLIHGVHDKKEYTLYINASVYWQNINVAIGHMIDFDKHRVVGVKFNHQKQAETLVEELEKRLVWNRLKRNYS